ncbi:hypothetical protein [Catenuloplanes indicus]|uniref:Uncharacterized protein n=1 Tax=Catenuloplanes indicus TaxID=137267 RepID=A0AAE4B282_9ACTN|nr:hypothetical protein [Catenuloplanes indicus]MDQ0371419.1 hypothetical protein [Catenuloplanes indicus]
MAHMIGPVPYPIDHQLFDRTAKTRAMTEAAGRLGLDLRRGRLAADWTTARSEACFADVRATMRAIAAAFGGEFEDNPLGALRQVVTVHPLGGAARSGTCATGCRSARCA